MKLREEAGIQGEILEVLGSSAQEFRRGLPGDPPGGFWRSWWQRTCIHVRWVGGLLGGLLGGW
eukprot:748552-Amorphochlora_amoeboformis.AAC.1